MSVGQQLLDVPLPAMVEKLGMGIANAQRSLDKNSVKIAKELANNQIEVVPQVTRTIQENGDVKYETPEPVKMSLLQAGLNPTFYQFSEATIDVEMDIKTKLQTETNVSVSAEASANFGVFSGSIQTEVEHNRKFGKTVEGTSHLTTKLQPVPAPPLMQPEVETVDNRSNDSDDDSN